MMAIAPIVPHYLMGIAAGAGILGVRDGIGIANAGLSPLARSQCTRHACKRCVLQARPPKPSCQHAWAPPISMHRGPAPLLVPLRSSS
jgi:hypothetical protein